MIAIKNMKNIPNRCIECGLKSGGYCYHKKPPYNLNEFYLLKEKPIDCPLVEIVTCKDCNNHGICKDRSDIDGARYCPTLHTYTGYDFYCGDGERRE